MGQMSGVVEPELTPSIRCVLRIARVSRQRAIQRVQTIVMSCGAVGDVPGELGVVQLCRVNLERVSELDVPI